MNVSKTNSVICPEYQVSKDYYYYVLLSKDEQKYTYKNLFDFLENGLFQIDSDLKSLCFLKLLVK